MHGSDTLVGLVGVVGRRGECIGIVPATAFIGSVGDIYGVNRCFKRLGKVMIMLFPSRRA